MGYQALILSDKEASSLVQILKREPLLTFVDESTEHVTFEHRDEKKISLSVYPHHEACKMWKDAKSLIEYYDLLTKDNEHPPKIYLDLYQRIKPHLGNIRWINDYLDDPSTEEPPQLRG